MKMYKIEDKKPKEGKSILGFNCKSNSWVVCSIVFGMSIKERIGLPSNHPDKRSYAFADEEGNNLVPYRFKGEGLSSYFGQDITHWCKLPKKIKKEKDMSKKTINVFEIHKGEIDSEELESYNVGDIYTTTNKGDLQINHKVVSKSDVMKISNNREVIKYEISYVKKYKNELIKHLSSDFSNAFIIITPTKKGDIIIDFSLDVDEYFKIIDKLK